MAEAWSLHGGATGGEEFDRPAEVDAAARTQRRVTLGYLAVFALMVVAIPLLTALLPWWSRARLVGGMSPGFVVAAGGMYVVFLVLGIAAARLARTIEDRMLGRTGAGDGGDDPA